MPRLSSKDFPNSQSPMSRISKAGQLQVQAGGVPLPLSFQDAALHPVETDT